MKSSYFDDGDLQLERNCQKCLQVICNLFLPFLPIEKINAELFEKLIPKISALFQNIIIDIKDIIQSEDLDCNKTENITDFLEAICSLLCNVLISIEFLNKETSIMLEHFYSLPENIIAFLKKIYNHCKLSIFMFIMILDGMKWHKFNGQEDRN
ncbi:uncharacterized protein LOC111639548 [Centruroides sculpturatus]|uniref:uncharacterized protein LOC111639548 n=1 Tax=Centruroides sculpturatus TaxID=218467 RepID=UPI000C6EF4DD|nr:uncharacterized protein LOC111639548 [Centruroides sculpturatus]